MFHRLLDRIEVRVGRYRGIRNLMTYVIAAMATVWVADLVLGSAMGIYLSGWLSFNRAKILQGQIWRIVTFVFTTSGQSDLFFLMHLLFVYFTGNLLQNQWGTLRFNLFYFSGLLCSLIAGFITGYATSYYINLSLLLAVAILYPAMQVNLYGIVPIRMKWLAVLELVLLLPGLLNGNWSIRIAIIISLLNVLLFLSERLMQQIKSAKRRHDWKKNWRTGNWR